MATVRNCASIVAIGIDDGGDVYIQGFVGEEALKRWQDEETMHNGSTLASYKHYIIRGENLTYEDHT